MNFFPPVGLLGACIGAGDVITLPPSPLGACAGGYGGSSVAYLFIAFFGIVFALSVLVGLLCYAGFRFLPRYKVKGAEWARKEATQAATRMLALLLVLVFVGVYVAELF